MLNNYYDRLKTFAASKLFLKVIVLLVLAQAAWYAFTFVPSIFDEATHLGFIEMYSERLNPFIVLQDTNWDFLGETSRNPSYLYYYLMSLPLRLMQFLGFTTFGYVVVLRLLHTLIFAAGVVIFDKALRNLKFSKVVSRLSLLALVLTPSVAILPGAISYDNVAFLFAALLFLSASKILKSKSLDQDQVVKYLLIAIFGSLMKYTFIAVAIPVSLFLLVNSIKNNKFKTIKNIDFGTRKINSVTKRANTRLYSVYRATS